MPWKVLLLMCFGGVVFGVAGGLGLGGSGVPQVIPTLMQCDMSKLFSGPHCQE